jgi:hypothetical protein
MCCCDQPLQRRTGCRRRRQPGLRQRGGVARVGLRLGEGIHPLTVRGVGHLRAHIHAAQDGPADVIALLFGRGHARPAAAQAPVGQHGQHAHRHAFVHLPGHLGRVASQHLHMAAGQRAQRLAAAFKRHKAHGLVADAGGARQQRGFHPVLAADGAARAKHHGIGAAPQCRHQVAQRGIGCVAPHGDHAMVQPQRRPPSARRARCTGQIGPAPGSAMSLPRRRRWWPHLPAAGAPRC